jgi:hypothetical protein
MSVQPPTDSAAMVGNMAVSNTANRPDRLRVKAGALTWSNPFLNIVILLASRAPAGLPEVPRNSNEQLNAAAA